MFHLDTKRQLRVCGKIMRQPRNKSVLSEARILLLHHVLPTTEELVYLFLETGSEIHTFFSKPFSINQNVLERLDSKGINFIHKSYDELENGDFIQKALLDAIELSKSDNKPIIILEVGGYFAKFLKDLSPENIKYISGVVEDTTFGHNRYEEVIKSLQIPIVSVAKSPIKELEAKYVGRDAVLALDLLFRDLGISLVNRNALVVGYGMIGKNVAGALKDYRLNVSVYDILDYKLLLAFGAGYTVHKKPELLKKVDIILSATGDENGAISLREIEMCKDNVVLASVGSKDTEFDLKSIEEESISKEQFGDLITKYKLPSDKNVFMIKKGAAINFILSSIPAEILDLLFAEVVLSTILLLKDLKDKFLLGEINYITDNHRDYISKEWIKYINH
jgi:adenosylhomocysteinase